MKGFKMGCNHTQVAGVVDFGDRIPIEGGGCTTILFHICPEPCKGAVPFTTGNFELLSSKTIEEIEVRLREQGIHLVTG